MTKIKEAKKPNKPAKNHPWKADSRVHAKDNRRDYTHTRMAVGNRMGIAI